MTIETEEWEKFIRRLLATAFDCPHCGNSGTVKYISQEGNAYDLESSKGNVARTAHVSYPIIGPVPYRSDDNGYGVMQCMKGTCRGIFIIEAKARGLPIAVWPLAGVSVSKHVPKTISFAVRDAKLSLAAGSVTGAVESIATATERMLRVEKVADFTKLWEKKKLPPDYFGAINEPRLWGNVVKHDRFNPDKVELKDARELIEYFDLILDIVYVTKAKLDALTERRKAIKEK